MTTINNNEALFNDNNAPASANDFLRYCEIEYERRVSSGEPFNESLFRNAIELVLNKLRNLENRGCV